MEIGAGVWVDTVVKTLKFPLTGLYFLSKTEGKLINWEWHINFFIRANLLSFGVFFGVFIFSLLVSLGVFFHTEVRFLNFSYFLKIFNV